jgi:pSer/pThr/pTyr-binding forkhead associated (FHA) protein
MSKTITYTIGRSKEADITYTDPTVSNMHAHIEMDTSKDEITLIDHQSTNGTYINGVRIQRAVLHTHDEVAFGNFTIAAVDLIDTIKTKYNNSKSDFKKEYQKMLESFQIYQTKMNKLTDVSKTPIYIRLFFGVLMLLLLILFPDLLPNGNLRYGLMAFIGLLSVGSGLIGPSQSEKSEMIALLKLEYEDVLVCPKCKTKLISNNYTYLNGRKRCISDKCDAIF